MIERPSKRIDLFVRIGVKKSRGALQPEDSTVYGRSVCSLRTVIMYDVLIRMYQLGVATICYSVD